MPDTPNPESLNEIVNALRREVGDLRAEVSAIKKGSSNPPGVSATAKCTQCGAENRLDAVYCNQCGSPQTASSRSAVPEADGAVRLHVAPTPAPDAKCVQCGENAAPGAKYCIKCASALFASGLAKPTSGPSKPKGLPKPQAPSKPETAKQARSISSGISTEQFVGERLLHYVGLVLVAMGIAFFLLWRAAHATPPERVFSSVMTGLSLLALGEYFKRKPPYDKLSNGIIGGGWTILYLTAYAAHHFDATRILNDPMTELVILAVVALGMIAHALRLNSRPFRVYCFGLTYFIFFLCREEVRSFDGFLLLVAASSLIAVESGFADILVVSVLGFYANYMPVVFRVTATPEAARSLAAFALPFFWLAGGYLIFAAVPLFPKARKQLMTPENQHALDAALSLSAAAFAIIAAGMGMEYFHHTSLMRAAGLSLFLVIPGILYLIFLPHDFGPSSVCPVAGLLIIAAGIASMPSPLWKMLAWIATASIWVWVGLIFDHAAWRIAGLLMSVTAFGFFFYVSGVSEHDRRAASMTMFVFSGLSYLASRYYRMWLKGPLRDWEAPAMEYWLYVGSAALVLALWGLLDPAPLAVTLAALAIAGEFAAVYFGRIHLWAQASMGLLGVGVYTFFIDYGPNLEVLGGLSTRVLTTACVGSAMAYMIYADPTPADFTAGWNRWTHKQHRDALSWMLAAVVGYTIYCELDPRMRLPAWALCTSLLFFLGRERNEDHLKTQAIAFALATGIEGYLAYMNGPSALLGEASSRHTAIYWGSSILLLSNLMLTRSSKRPPSAIDIQSGWIFSAISIAMMAYYLGKELNSYHLTIAWTGEGITFLILGLILNFPELRLPSLLLLGICVAKAMLIDTSELPLPQRVATFLVLGTVLLAASMMYVRVSAGDKKDPPSSYI